MAGTTNGTNGQVPQAPIGLNGKGGLATPQRQYYPASEQYTGASTMDMLKYTNPFTGQEQTGSSTGRNHLNAMAKKYGTDGDWMDGVDRNAASMPRADPMPLPPHLQAELDRRNGNESPAFGPVGGPALPIPAPPRGGETGYGMSQQPAFNVNQAAAAGLQQAGLGAASEMNYRPMEVNPALVAQKGYNPSIMDGVDPISANNVTGTGYDASTIGDVRTVSADNVQAGQLAGSDLSAYTNPYETQVVDQALGDIERNRLMAQNVGSAQAGAANAFGGSRQGIAEAETNRAYMEQAAKTASGLRQAGYMNAQEQSGQDIGRRMQASLANQQANMQAGQFNANTDLQSQQANQSAFNQAGQFGASALNQGNLANQSANMQAQQASASNALAAQQANQGARNNAGQFGANAFNQAGQLNQSAMMQARLANQNAGLSGSQQRLNAGQQLGNLSNLGFGMGQQIQGRMDQQGAAQQNLQQQIINAAKGQYGGFTGAPNQSLQALLAAVGGAPAVGSQTSGYTPGLFDYLSLGMGR